VALLSREPPATVVHGFGSTEFDPEGRCLAARVGGVTVVSLYLPSGSSSPERQAAKFRFLAEFTPQLARMRTTGRHVVCGDWNIAHREIDLKNWRANRKNSGFLPEERAWLDAVLAPGQWSDAFRVLHPDAEQYTWWSNRGQAWAKNVGWRIDYQMVSPDLHGTAARAEIHREPRFSDHAPLIMDYSFG
jgi:exodeoxyribonuclease III